MLFTVSEKYTKPKKLFLRALPPVIVCAVALAIAFNIILNFQSGIDLTDESFYLVHSTQPENIRSSLTSFGYYSKFIFKLANGNINHFRLIGFGLLLSLALFFSWSLNCYLNNKLRNANDALTFSWIITLAIAVTFYYSTWLVTPSYNFIVLNSCLLISASAILILVDKSKNIKNSIRHGNIREYLYISFIVAGLHFCFISKPPSALLSYILVVLLFFKAYAPLRAIFTSIVVGLLWVILFLLHVYFFDGSLNHYLDRISLAWELNSLLNSTLQPYYLFEKLLFYIKKLLSNVVIVAIGTSLLFTVYGFLKFSKSLKVSSVVSKFNTPIKLSLFIGLFILTYENKLFNGADVGKGMGMLLCFLIVWYWLFDTDLIQKNSNKISTMELFVCLIWLYSFSMAFSIGSSIHPILKSSHSLIFCVGCISVIVRATHSEDAFPGIEYWYIACILLTITITLNFAQSKPYRLITPLSKQNTKVLIPIDGEPHKVDSKTANYINSLSQSAKDSGWKEGTTLLDLTGGTPFASYFLKAKVVVTPWYFGDKPKSSEWLVKVLSHAEKGDLRKAWILLAPKGRIRFDRNLLFEIDELKNIEYEKVGSFTTGFRNELHELWKPAESIVGKNN